MVTQRSASDAGERQNAGKMVVRRECVTPSTELDNLDMLLFSSTASPFVAEGQGTASLAVTEKDKFAIVCSKKLMRSWVSQPSPCCAAASVAGALNALSTKEPDWTCVQLLEYYKVMTRDRTSRQKRIVQLQTAASEQEIADLEAAVREHVASNGEFEFGGPKKISQKLLLDAVSSCLKESPNRYPAFHSELMLDDADSVESDTSVSGAGDGELEARENEIKSSSTAFEIDFRTGDRRSSSAEQHGRKQHLQDVLYQYLHLVDGLAKLERPVKPSTAICGNEAILRAIEAVNASETELNRLGATGRTLHATLFMGKQVSSSTTRCSNPVTWQISPGDSEERRTKVWDGLWREFSRDSTVLIYHLKNHYALVFAMREWQEQPSLKGEQEPTPPRSLQCREILTARKGQRPSVWIAWDEVYKTLCAWHGYKILSISIEA